MQAHIATFSSPVTWLRRTALALKKSPFGMVSISIFYVFSMTALGTLPVIGLVLASLFMPFGTMLVINGTRQVFLGEQPSYAILGNLFKNADVRARLIRVGLVYAGFILAADFVYAVMAADSISKWEIVNDRLVWETVWPNFPWVAVGCALLVYIIGQMATWFAPALVAWKNMPAGKAIFYSFFGCLKNWLPIVVLLVLLTASITGCAITVSLICQILGISDYMLFVMTPVAFLLTAWAYGTILPMWVDIFGDVSAEN